MSEEARYAPNAARLKRSREAGDAPISRLACTVAATVAGGGMLVLRAPQLARELRALAAQAWTLDLAPRAALATASRLLLSAVLLVGGFACVAALLVGLVQSRGLFRAGLLFRPARVHRAGWPGRWVLVVVLGAMLFALRHDWASWVRGEANLPLRAMGTLAILAGLVGAADGLFAYLAFVRRNRLTRREAIGDAREGQVSPELKAELRRRAR